MPCWRPAWWAVQLLLLPILVVVWLSCRVKDLLGPLRFVGLANWRSMPADSGFADSLVVTAVFVAIVVPARSSTGFAFFGPACRAPACSATRACCAWICAPLAIAVMWRWIVAPTDGAINAVLGHHRMAHRSR